MADEICGVATLDAAEHDILAEALNSCLLDMGLGQPVRYWIDG
jgi:hypothetical protein